MNMSPFHSAKITKKVGNVDFLESGKGFSKINTSSILGIKKHLSLSKIPCRKN